MTLSGLAPKNRASRGGVSSRVPKWLCMWSVAHDRPCSGYFMYYIPTLWAALALLACSCSCHGPCHVTMSKKSKTRWFVTGLTGRLLLCPLLDHRPAGTGKQGSSKHQCGAGWPITDLEKPNRASRRGPGAAEAHLGTSR